MTTIVLLGSGNVAEQLLKSFYSNKNVKVLQLYSRNVIDGQNLATNYNISFTSNLQEINSKAGLYIMAVNDSAIRDLSISLPFYNKLVAHTSGATDIDVIDDRNRGAVFYPVQTFTKGRNVNMKETPICIECYNKYDLEVLENVAKSISDNVKFISSEKRIHLHLASVFANNFGNHMFYVANEILKNNG